MKALLRRGKHSYVLGDPINYVDQNGFNPLGAGNGPTQGRHQNVPPAGGGYSYGICDGFSLHVGWGYQSEWCYVHTPGGSTEIRNHGWGPGLDGGLQLSTFRSNAQCPGDLEGLFQNLSAGGGGGITVTGNYAGGYTSDGRYIWVEQVGAGPGIKVKNPKAGGSAAQTRTDILLGHGCDC